jgi:P27 family predicted phage terminase small subunit
MARPKLSEDHHKLAGTPVFKSKAKQESKLPADQPAMPSHLSRDARKQWKILLPMLLQRRSLTDGDALALSLLAETSARWVLAKRDVEEFGLVVTTSVLDKSGTAVEVRKANPALRVVENCERSLKTYLREFALTPATRERVLPAKQKEKQPQTLLQKMQRERGEL